MLFGTVGYMSPEQASRRGGRFPRGSVRVRRHLVRAGDGRPRVPPADERRNVVDDHPRRARASARGESRASVCRSSGRSSGACRRTPPIATPRRATSRVTCRRCAITPPISIRSRGRVSRPRTRRSTLLVAGAIALPPPWARGQRPCTSRAGPVRLVPPKRAALTIQAAHVQARFHTECALRARRSDDHLCGRVGRRAGPAVRNGSAWAPSRGRSARRDAGLASISVDSASWR